MALEALKAALADLMAQMAEQPEDLHQLHEELREKLAELRALGLPVPQDIADLEDWLGGSLGAAPDAGDTDGDTGG